MLLLLCSLPPYAAWTACVTPFSTTGDVHLRIQVYNDTGYALDIDSVYISWVPDSADPCSKPPPNSYASGGVNPTRVEDDATFRTTDCTNQLVLKYV